MMLKQLHVALIISLMVSYAKSLVQTLEKPFPYEFPILGLLDDRTPFPMPLCHGFKLEEATIDQLQETMSNGSLTSVQIVRCYLQRIYQTDEYLK